MSRKRKKSKKKRGSRTHGYGAARKHRGAGSRGGRGRAGRGKKAKHKKLTALKEKKEEGEDKGFTRPQQKSVTTINLMDIDQQLEEFVEQGQAEKKGDRYLFNARQAGIDKVLGKGQLRQKIDIKADKFSSKARKKIEEAGCKAITEESESA